MKIASVSEFLECLNRDEWFVTTECIYRGQGNSDWKVDCSAVRRLEAYRDSRIVPQIVGHSLVAYLANLLNEGSRYIGTCPELPRGCSDLDLLVQLQHQGAATGLIDFTLSPLVALWFACTGHPEKDGAVYVLPRTRTQDIDRDQVQRRGLLNYFYGIGDHDWTTSHLYLLSPRVMDGRPASQQSVFVLGAPFIWPALLKKVEIDKNAKKDLLAELRTSHDLTEESLFVDFAGFAQANSFSRPFDTINTVEFWTERIRGITERTEKAQAHVDCGMAYSAIEDHEHAIAQYTEAIRLDPNNIGAYVNRATERRSLDDLAGALTDLNVAIRLCAEHEGEVDKRKVAMVYWSRGQVYFALGQEDQGWTDQGHARDLGLGIYYNEKGERGPRLDLIPEQLETYQLLTGDGEGRP